MRIRSKLRAVLLVTLTLSTTAQIALPVLAQGVLAPAKVDSGSYGPVVTIVSPEYSDVLTGETEIAIAIAPRRYPAQTVELLVDGRSVSGVLPVQNKFAWKTGMFIDGPHTLTVRVTDTQGFIGQSETTIYINNQRKADNQSPILRWLGVTAGQTLSGITKLRLEAADNFGVKYVFLNLNTAIAPDIKPPLASWMTNRPPYEFSVDTSAFKDGLYVLDAYAWDDMENERNALRLTVKFLNHGTNRIFTPDPMTVPDPTVTPDPGVTPRVPDPIPTITGGLATMPPVLPPQPPSTTIFSTPRNGAMNIEPAKNAVSQMNPLHATSTISSAKISRPPDSLRSQQKAAPVETVAPPPLKPTEAKPPIVSSSTPKVPTPPRVTNLPDFPSLPVQSTPRLTPVGNTMQKQAAQMASTPVASTPAALNVPERQAISRTVLATSPSLTPRFSGAAKPLQNASAEVSFAAGITVAGKQEPLTGEPFGVSSAGVWAGANPARIANANAALPTAPAGGVRMAVGERQPQQTPAPNAHQPNRPPANPFNNNAVPATRPAPAQNATAPDAERTAASPRVTSPLYSALPERTPLPTRSSAQGQLTPVEKSPLPNARIAESRFVAPSRTVRFSAIPTLPRLAVSPVVTWREKTPSDRAIVIAPSPDARPYYVATANESLAAIAARHKMPVSAVAEANKVSPKSFVIKGTRVLLPQALLVSYKGQAVTGDVAPLLIGSTSVAPFRFLFEKQGGKMTWDADGQRVTARNGTYEVTLEIGSDKAVVNKEEVLMDMAAFLLSGRTMVPIRFFEKALQAKVEWEPATGRIFVAMTP